MDFSDRRERRKYTKHHMLSNKQEVSYGFEASKVEGIGFGRLSQIILNCKRNWKVVAKGAFEIKRMSDLLSRLKLGDVNEIAKLLYL